MSCFLEGGSLVDYMRRELRIGSMDQLIRCLPLDERQVSQLSTSLKGIKIRLEHLGHTKKFKSFAGAANDKASSFKREDSDVIITVAQYFEEKAATSDAYKEALKNGKLEFPGLPCVNVGSKNRPILIPAELVTIPAGQFRHKLTPVIVSKIIKEAAAKPAIRQKYISEGM